MRSKPIAGLAVLAAGAIILAGCSSSSSTGDAAAPEEEVAASYYDADTEYVDPVIIYPPFGLVGDDGELTGQTVDFADRLAEILGITITHKEDAWENMLTGTQSGQYIWTQAAEITAERLEVFDFAYVHDTFARFLAPAGSEEVGDDDMDLCGYTIAAVSGATLAGSLPQTSEKCVAEGLEPIETAGFKDLAAALLAVQSGQVDLFAVDGLAAIDITSSDDSVMMTGPEYHRSKVGIAMMKGTGAVDEVSAAINEMIADGSYMEILEKWNMGDNAISESTVNPEPAEE